MENIAEILGADAAEYADGRENSAFAETPF